MRDALGADDLGATGACPGQAGHRTDVRPLLRRHPPQRRIELHAGRERPGPSQRHLLSDQACARLGPVRHRRRRPHRQHAERPEEPGRRSGPSRRRSKASSPRSASSQPTSTMWRSRIRTAITSAISSCSRQSTLVVQKAEWEWKPPVGVALRKSGMKAITPDGDHDLFGDGSVMLIATHGHSPGHQNMLVRLPKTGAIMFTGDSVHTKANWDSGRVPQRNFNVPQSLEALERMRAVLKEAKARALDRPRAERGAEPQIRARLLRVSGGKSVARPSQKAARPAAARSSARRSPSTAAKAGNPNANHHRNSTW